jgi:hypothetical protein
MDRNRLWYCGCYNRCPKPSIFVKENERISSTKDSRRGDDVGKNGWLQAAQCPAVAGDTGSKTIIKETFSPIFLKLQSVTGYRGTKKTQEGHFTN